MTPSPSWLWFYVHLTSNINVPFCKTFSTFHNHTYVPVCIHTHHTHTIVGQHPDLVTSSSTNLVIQSLMKRWFALQAPPLPNNAVRVGHGFRGTSLPSRISRALDTEHLWKAMLGPQTWTSALVCCKLPGPHSYRQNPGEATQWADCLS